MISNEQWLCSCMHSKWQHFNDFHGSQCKFNDLEGCGCFWYDPITNLEYLEAENEAK